MMWNFSQRLTITDNVTDIIKKPLLCEVSCQEYANNIITFLHQTELSELQGHK